MVWEQSEIEKILCALDAKQCIFPGYELVKVNNQLCLVGKGGFSSVYEIKCLENPEKKYVLKVMGFDKKIMTSENFWNTVKLQYSLSEQNQYVCRLISARELRIILDEEARLQEVAEVQGEAWNEEGMHLQFILMERLQDNISKNRFGRITLLREELANEEGVIDFAIQIGQAIQCAHSNNVLHRDIKLENIFWDDATKCYKLGDFGIAKYTVEGNAETVVYTDGYGAPEIERRLNDYYNATADIYSFGITLYLLMNDFRFPGSEGYYVNMVQYNPEFIFPAPAHASVGMVRIIRKMCQYHKEDRYQSIEEILMDLIALRSNNSKNVQEEMVYNVDFVTETYREEKVLNDTSEEKVEKTGLNARAKRKEDERIYKEIYIETSVWHFIGFSILLTLLMINLQPDVSIIYNSKFWILPIMVLIEVILLGIKEFHIFFAVVTLGVGIYLCFCLGISIPYVMLLGGCMTGIPIVAGACVTSTMLWTVIMATEKLQWLDFISNHDLIWILIVLVLFVLSHYVLIRIDFDKTTYYEIKNGELLFFKIYLLMIAIGVVLFGLERIVDIQIPEIIQQIHLVRTGFVSLVLFVLYISWNGYIDDEEDGMNENDLDKRRDGEYSDTIE